VVLDEVPGVLGVLALAPLLQVTRPARQPAGVVDAVNGRTFWPMAVSMRFYFAK
jgi:hypothetical protein